MERFLALLALSLLLFSCQPKNSEILDCWINSYGEDFDFLSELDDLDGQLIDAGIVKSGSLDDYQELFRRFEHEDIDLSDLEIRQYVREDEFKECASSISSNNLDDRTYKYLLLFSIYHIQSKELARVRIDITDNSGGVLIDGEKAIEENLINNLLSKRIDEKVESGIDREEVIITLTVADSVKMGFLSDIQQMLRELDALKVEYIAPNTFNSYDEYEEWRKYGQNGLIERFHPEEKEIFEEDTLIKEKNISISITEKSTDSYVIQEFESDGVNYRDKYRDSEYNIIIKMSDNLLIDTTFSKENFLQFTSQEFLDIATFIGYWFELIDRDQIVFFGAINKPETDWSYAFYHHFNITTKEFEVVEYEEDEM